MCPSVNEFSTADAFVSYFVMDSSLLVGLFSTSLQASFLRCKILQLVIFLICEVLLILL